MGDQFVTEARLEFANDAAFLRRVKYIDKELTKLERKRRVGIVLDEAKVKGPLGKLKRDLAKLARKRRIGLQVDDKASLRQVRALEKNLARVEKKRRIRIVLDSPPTPAVKKLNQELDKSGRATEQLTTRNKSAKGVFADLRRNVVGLLAAYVGLRAALHAVSSSVANFTGLDDQLLIVKAMTGATEEAIARLGALAKYLGETTRFTAREAGTVEAILARAGFAVEESLAALPSILALSSAGAVDLGSSAKITANILRAFGYEASRAGEVADVLATGAASAFVGVEELGQGLKFVSPIARSLQIPLEEMASALATAADRGLDTTLMARGLRSAFGNLIDPSNDGAKELKRLGISLDEVDFQGESLLDVMQRLAKSPFDVTSAYRIFSSQSATSVLTLLSAIEDFSSRTDKLLYESGNKAQWMSEIMESGLGGTGRRLRSVVEAVGISFAEGFRPTLQGAGQDSIALAGESKELAEAIGSLLGGSLKTVSTLALATADNVGILAAAVGVLAASRLALFLDSAAAAMFRLNAAVVANPFFAAAAGVTVLVAAINSWAKDAAREYEAATQRMIKNSQDLRTSIAEWQKMIADPQSAAALGISLEKANRQIEEYHKQLDALLAKRERMRKAPRPGGDAEGLSETGLADTSRIDEEIGHLQSRLKTTEAYAARMKRRLEELPEGFKKGMKGVPEALEPTAEEIQDAANLVKGLRTEQEKLDDELREAEKLYKKRLIDEETMGRARAKHAKATAELVKKSDSHTDSINAEIARYEVLKRLLTENQDVASDVAAKAAELLAAQGITAQTEGEAFEDAARGALELAKRLSDAKRAVEDITKAEEKRTKAKEDADNAAEKEKEKRAAALKAFQGQRVQLEAVAGIMLRYGESQEIASAAARLMAEANIGAAEALAMVRAEASQRSLVENLTRQQEHAAAIVAGLKSNVTRYLEEVDRVDRLVKARQLSPEFAEEYKKQLKDQLEGWERVGLAASEAAERVGGAWGKVFEFLGEHMEGIAGAFGKLSEIAADYGDETLSKILSAGQAFASGDRGAGVAALVGATGVGRQSTSPFGALSEGSFVQEGASFGAQFGGWGALIGAGLGALFKKGADDLHSHLMEAGGYAVLRITQAQGELGKVGEEMSQYISEFLNTLQGTIVADLDFGAGGAEIHIREDRIRVVVEGIERVFHDMDEAMDFFLRGVLHANAGVEGLGEEMRRFFENASKMGDLGDTAGLQKALDLAMRVDTDTTGVDQALLRRYREEESVARDFGLSLDKVIALRRKELAQTKAQLEAQARGALGATDFAGPTAELVKGLQGYNATAALQVQLDRKRSEVLQAEIAAYEAANAADVSLTETLVAGSAEREVVAGRFRDDNELMVVAIDESRVAARDARDEYRRNVEEYEALQRTLSETSPLVADLEKQIGRLWEKTAADAGLALIQMMQAVEGPASHIEEQRKLQNTLFMLQLASQINAAQVVYETMQFVTEEGRRLFQGLIADAQAMWEGFASGDLQLPAVAGGAGSGGGGGRRQQKREEERRAAEEAAQTLADFNSELRTLDMNLSSASGSLGDLASRLDEVIRRAQEARAAGASEEDVRRFESLSFRQERQGILEPFARPENFVSLAADIERQRRAGLEQARLLAETKAGELNVPFERVFASMEAEISKGAQRMEAALVRATVDALGLPLESTRREMQGFRQALRDLDLAYKAGAISSGRYRDLIAQVQAEQARSLEGDVLGMLDKYYKEVEGRESFRQEYEAATFEIELANNRLRLEMLAAEGALAQEAYERINGFVSYMEANPPDWEELLSPPEGQVRASFGGGSGIGAATAAAAIDDLATAIRTFLQDFDRTDVGRFTSQAMDWLATFEDFDKRLGALLHPQGANVESIISNLGASLFGIADVFALTDEQLQEILATVPQANVYYDQIKAAIEALAAANDLPEARAKAAGKLLAMYRGEVSATNDLAQRYAAITAEYYDIATAMELLGASAEDLAELESIRQQRMLAFWDDAYSGLRSVAEEIRGGAFGGVHSREALGRAEARWLEIQRRLTTNPGDLGALADSEEAVRAYIEALQGYSGGVGAEYRRLMQEALAFIDGLETPDVTEPPPPQAAPEMLERMDLQVLAQEATNATLESIQAIAAEQRDLATEQRDLLGKLLAAQGSNSSLWIYDGKRN